MTNPILTHLDRGTLVRGKWGDGREIACLYSALVPGATSTDDCPAEVMPQWLADVTPYLNDCVSDDGWAGRMRRYGEASVRWRVLTHDQWETIRRQWAADCVEFALGQVGKMNHGDYWPAIRSACEAVIVRLRKNEDPTEDEIEAADAAAWAAAEAAWARAARAAWAAARAAWAAVGEAAAAAWAAEAEAEAAAAWDHLFDRLMDRIEDALKGERGE